MKARRPEQKPCSTNQQIRRHIHRAGRLDPISTPQPDTRHRDRPVSHHAVGLRHLFRPVEQGFLRPQPPLADDRRQPAIDGRGPSIGKQDQVRRLAGRIHSREPQRRGTVEHPGPGRGRGRGSKRGAGRQPAARPRKRAKTPAPKAPKLSEREKVEATWTNVAAVIEQGKRVTTMLPYVLAVDPRPAKPPKAPHVVKHSYPAQRATADGRGQAVVA